MPDPQCSIVQARQRRRLGNVCIIGAGVSGLRAANLLATAGLQVTILEARNRVGGRIHQTSRLGAPLDLGASWIHGTQGNPLVDLAKEAGATTVPCGAVDSICDPDGNWLGKDVAKKYYEEVWEILNIAMDRSAGEHMSISDSETMLNFFQQEVRKRRSQSEQPEAYEALMIQIVEMWGAFMGEESRQDSVIDIEAADGFRDIFDHVIVTVPLGWLKHNQNIFRPPLTPTVCTAIQSLGYGNLEKVFIKFPSAFWDTRDLNDGQAHHNKSKPGPSFPIESLFLRPEYAVETNPAQWQQEIISYSGLPGPYSQPIIMFFVHGQWGRHITSLVRGMHDDTEEYNRILDKHFRPYYSKLPHYDPTSPDCYPSQFLTTDWQNDRLAGYGSFANQPVGRGDSEQHFEALRAGMGDRGIWFAGEHTSPPGGLGTVVGAYWSGGEAAQRVASCYGVSLQAKDVE
ncbi:hypothetical protein S40288_07605 [Stachybotrys chartarum IBT 40288]|nr:hypothetical protein S40288_07605 [Stachybotrys chartarum IBT 40288]